MNIQIIQQNKDEVQIQLYDQGVKLLSLMLIQSSNYYRPFYRTLSMNNQKRKIIPFLIENFVKFLKRKQFFTQQQFMEDILKTRKGLKYRCQDLAKIFMNRENLEIQLNWIDYLEGFAAIDIQRNIGSKKVLEMLQLQINQPRPYYCLIKFNKNYVPKENKQEFYNPPLILMDRGQILRKGFARKKKMIIK